MADNYLERRMEEHRLAQHGGVNRRHVTGLKRGQVAVDYPSMRILVAGADDDCGQAVVSGFRRMGCRVALTAANVKVGTAMAQRSGAQYHPGGVMEALERLAAAGDSVEVLVDIAGLTAIGEIASQFPDVRCIVPPGFILQNGPEAVASWCIFVAHPKNAWAIHL